MISISFTATILAAVLLLSTSAFAQGRDDQPDLAINADTRTEVMEGVIKRLNDFYVFPEVAKKMETAIRLHWQIKSMTKSPVLLCWPKR